MSLLRCASLSLLAALGCAASAAAAGDPIMPLSDVKPGMACTGYTVVHGTEVSSFDAAIVDIVNDGDGETRVLARISGPAVDATGAGPGFSGSPIYCPGTDGVQRVVGGLSEGVGEYGNKLVLATPIEEMLGEPVTPPSAAPRERRTVRSARPLGLPLSLSGVAAPVAEAFQQAATRTGRVLYVAPAAPRDAFPPQQLRPGSSMAAGLASGTIAASAIGTVTYVDGDAIWAFGHPLDSAGARSLFLQDAYVYTVVSNPIGAPDLSTYKLAAPGHDIGTLTGDGIAAVTGRLGVLPPSYPMTVTATDLDTGNRRVSAVRIADERDVGLPTGTSALPLIGSATLAQAAYSILHGSPTRTSGHMCVSIAAQELATPMRFCNDYVAAGAGSASSGAATLTGAPQVVDFVQAASLIDSYILGPLHLTAIDVDLGLQRGLAQAFLEDVQAPHRVRRGSDVQVRARLRLVGGGTATRTFTVHVPRGMPAGRRDLVLSGTPSDAAGGANAALTSMFEAPSAESGPTSVTALARAIAGIHRYDGVTASFRPPQSRDAPIDPATTPDALPSGPEGVALRERPVYRDPAFRISAAVKARVVVTPG